jgi:hypothetical protein
VPLHVGEKNLIKARSENNSFGGEKKVSEKFRAAKEQEEVEINWKTV